ncbi:class I SAM-dependent RNA methyltransferase [Aquipuribacter hungaricus]|uniref:Class I SAM-dependent RNA methyltransferase n=1 Tax=Aquipuribacter hungaricus TaxID=545624 RepID=A0ABV7WGR2_9MICO
MSQDLGRDGADRTGPADQAGPDDRPGAAPDDGLLTLTAGPVAHGGHVVARVGDAPDGRVVFVRHALPGEVVRVRLTDAGEGRSFWRGEAVEVLEASPHRVQPPCPYAHPGGCGGCDLQHVELTEQRRLKAAVVTEQLVRLGGVDPEQVLGGPVVVQALPEPGRAPGEETGLGWRTRVRYAVDRSGHPGFHRHRSHDVVPVTRCPQVTDAVDAVGVTRLPWPGVSGVQVSSGDDGAVVRAEHGPRRTRLPRVDALGLVGGTEDRPERVAGRTWVRHDVPGAGRLRVGVDGFWQAHATAAETFVAHVRRHAGVRPGDTVLDLYAGAGLFTVALAGDLGDAGELVAVESDRGAVADLRRNVHAAPAVRVVHDRVERALRGSDVPAAADVVVLDPPRAGARSAVVSAVVARGPRAVVLVACDPASLGRDTALLQERGYRLRALEAMDAFPMTHHVECVALFTPEAPA